MADLEPDRSTDLWHAGGARVSGSCAPAHYEIRVDGVLDKRWMTWFAGLEVATERTQTVISGPLPDQAALHGVLARVGDLGMCLISVRRLDPDPAEEQSPR